MKRKVYHSSSLIYVFLLIFFSNSYSAEILTHKKPNHEIIPTPDCNLNINAEVISCRFLVFSWGTGDASGVNVDIRVNGNVEESDYYGSSYSLRLFNNTPVPVVEIRPSSSSGEGECPWQTVSFIPPEPSDCDPCVASRGVFPFFVGCSSIRLGETPLAGRVEGLYSRTGEPIAMQTVGYEPNSGLAGVHTIVLDEPAKENEVYFADIAEAIVHPITGQIDTCRYRIPINTKDCSGNEYDLALTVEDRSQIGKNNGVGEFVVKLYNQTNESHDAVQVNLELPDAIVPTSGNTDWSGGPSNYSFSIPVELLPYETKEIPFHYIIPSETGDFEVVGEIVSMSSISGLEDRDSYMDFDLTNDNYLGDNIIDQDGKNGGDEDDHDKLMLNFEDQLLYDLALRVTTNTDTVSVADTVMFEVEVFNQGSIDVDGFEIQLHYNEFLQYYGSSWSFVDPDDTYLKYNSGSLSSGQSIVIPLELIAGVSQNEFEDIELVAEISEVLISGPLSPSDVDSEPDYDLYNDALIVDDEIDDNANDEDDHDIEDVVLHTEDIDMFDLSCGDSSNIDLDETPMPKLFPGMVIVVNGFPIQTTEVSGENGLFTGKGHMSLPFIEKYAEVEFENIWVNRKFHVTDGQVHLVSESFDIIDSLLSEFGNNESELNCTEIPVDSMQNNPNPASGLNELGFDSLGVYRLYDPSMPFDSMLDPNGFNSDSIHFETGTRYDENGCDIMGRDSLGNPCPSNPGDDHPPYYWLNDDPTKEGQDFYKRHADDLDSLIQDGLDSIYAHSLDSFLNFTCDPIRQKIIQNHANIPLNSNYTMKSDYSYLTKGMSNKFTSEPQILNIYDRGEVDSLEKNHIHLYHCDKIILGLTERHNTIQDFYNGNHNSELRDYIQNKMMSLTQEEIDDVETRLQEWINEQIYKYIFEEQDSWSFLFEDRRRHHFKIPRTSDVIEYHEKKYQKGNEPHLYSLHADLNTDSYSSKGYVGTAQFEYEQNQKYVQGIPRAYLVDEHAKIARKKSLSSGANSIKGPISLWNTTADGQDNKVVLHDLVFDATEGENKLNVSAVLNGFKSDQGIAFQASNIEFGPSGFIDTMKISLANNEFPIRLTNVSELVLEGNPNPELSDTYIMIDCHGFAGISVDGYIEFCSERFVPVDGSGNIQSGQPLRADFLASMPSFPDFYAEISIPRFAMTNNPEFQFEVEKAVLDFSTVKSVDPDSLDLPDFYLQEMSTQITDNSWIGFYLKKLDVEFENKFKEGETKSLTLEHFVIDDQGLSGLLSAINFVPLNEGSAGGWQASVDTLQIGFVSNRMVRSKINGEIVMSLTDHNGAMSYRGQIYPHWNFDLEVELESDLSVDLWKAKMDLYSGSYIQIGNVNGSLECFAHLNGKIDIDASEEKGKLQIGDIRFEKLELSTQAPYFSSGVWSMPEGVSRDFGGFELSVDNIFFGSAGNEEEPILKFRVALEINKNVDLYGQVGLEFIGQRSASTPQKWTLKEFKVNRIAVAGSFPGVDYIGGVLEFYDETSGGVSEEGFYGALEVQINSIQGTIQASAEFGKINNDKRYFFVDFMFIMGGSGVTLAPGINLYGIGGGISYHMNRSGQVGEFEHKTFDIETMNRGDAPSGFTYTVNENIGLGINAKIFLGLASKEVFNACASFGMQFNSPSHGGGIANVTISGDFAMLLDPGENLQCVNTQAPINGSIIVDYNFNNRTLFCSFNANVDIEGIITGSGSGELSFSPSGWYIMVGQHEHFNDPGLGPISLRVLKFAEFKSYFQTGNRVDPMPPLPAEVADLTELSNIGRSESAFATGRGLAFGQHIKIQAGKDKGKFRARLMAMAGYDVNFQKYSGITCAQTGSAIGMNGWYGMGQAYLYLDGRITFVPRKKEFDILRATLAGALQLKAPNPTYGRASFVVKYKILFWKGKHRVKVEIGEECDIQKDPSAGPLHFDIVNYIEPFNGSIDVMTSIEPKVIFNYDVPGNTEVTYDGSNYETYQLKLKDISFIQLGEVDSLNMDVAHEQVKGDKTIVLKPNYFLYPNEEYRIIVTTEVWQGDSLIETQLDTSLFETGDPLNAIPEGNVVSSYPIKGQYHYYKDQWTNSSDKKNFVKINRVQPFLFFDSEIIYTISDGGSRPVDIGKAVFELSEYKIKFDINESELGNGKAHRLDIYCIPKIEVNDAENMTAQELYNYTLFKAQLPALKYFFRVSDFNNFDEKIDYIVNSGLTDEDPSNQIKAGIPGVACFDKYEIFGYDVSSNSFSGELSLKMESIYDENSWYSGTIYPLIYAEPSFKNYLQNRAENWEERLSQYYSKHQRFPGLDLIMNVVKVPPTNSSFFYAEDFPPEITGFEDVNFQGRQHFYSMFFTSIQEHWDALAFTAWWWSVYGNPQWGYQNLVNSTRKLEGPLPLPKPWNRWSNDPAYAEFPEPDDLFLKVNLSYRIPFTNGYSGPISLDVENDISRCNYGSASNDDNGPHLSDPCYPAQTIPNLGDLNK